jgi:hypothetical protein
MQLYSPKTFLAMLTYDYCTTSRFTFGGFKSGFTHFIKKVLTKWILVVTVLIVSVMLTIDTTHI